MGKINKRRGRLLTETWYSHRKIPHSEIRLLKPKYHKEAHLLGIYSSKTFLSQKIKSSHH